ncbi:MAG: hypothetical protein FJ004_03905 [Chloroflexi bacterium]|nr:hypothetical protein [Chloroflexota bacterium]
MKLAAILVPLSFLVFFPMLIRIVMAIYMAMRGRNSHAREAPITQAQKKILFSLVFTYPLAFLSSLCWAIYVFTGSIVWAVAFTGYLLIAMGIFFTIGWRSSKRQKPYSLEELNKQADRQSKMILKLVLAMVIIPLVMAIAIVIIYVVAGN